MIVQAADKLFYVDPIWYGHIPKWAICPQDGSFSLFVEAVNAKDTVVKQARRIIQDWPIVLVGKRQYHDTMVFPQCPDAYHAFEFVLQIKGLLPMPDKWAAGMEEPPLDNLKYCWEVSFKTEHVLQYWQKKPHYLNGYLCDFLLGVSISSPYANLLKIRYKLARQFPGLGKLTLEAAIEKYGKRVVVKR